MLERNLKPVLITGATTVSAPENQFFRAITVLSLDTATDTISVKGGISQGLDQNDASDGSTYLANQETPADEKTGVNLNGTHSAGIYEFIPTVAVAINVPAGTTIYGRFTEVATGANDTVIAYM
jgi:hypothetical protein